MSLNLLSVTTAFPLSPFLSIAFIVMSLKPFLMTAAFPLSPFLSIAFIVMMAVFVLPREVFCLLVWKSRELQIFVVKHLFL